MPLESLIAAQSGWARNRWPGHSSKRAPSLEENLIVPLSVETRAEFDKGSGGELGRNGKPGKMTSLRSSSALSYNVFGPWRGLDLEPLSVALQTTIQFRSLRFEQKFRHGLSSTPPNLDVVLDLEGKSPLGIECKFSEPYGTKKDHAPLDQKYFVGRRARWTEVSLPDCQALASSTSRMATFRRLAAGQLLKHFLGLAHTTKHYPRLRYVWFDAMCPEAQEHRAEIERFKEQIDGTIDFASVTYQEIAASLRAHPEPIANYHAYLHARYFVASHVADVGAGCDDRSRRN